MGGNFNYDLGEYENRARAWITAMMLIPSIGANPKDSAGKTLIGYKKVSLLAIGNFALNSGMSNDDI